MYCSTWLPFIMSYYLMPSYELSYVILYHPRLSLMVSSRLSLKASVVRENVLAFQSGLRHEGHCDRENEAFKSQHWKNNIITP